MSVSTHVLDAATGTPATGVGLVVVDENGDVVTTAITDEDGRAKELLPGGSSAGVYTLVFDTGAYFEQAGIATFYPEVSVTFSVLDVDAHHHVPLLLSPFAYSTYRGS
ncbi:MAG: hydroxyisourate hydrolase [Rhodococcus sp. (in: high G+C Gram-positive bacteria)]